MKITCVIKCTCKIWHWMKPSTEHRGVDEKALFNLFYFYSRVTKPILRELEYNLTSLMIIENKNIRNSLRNFR